VFLKCILVQKVGFVKYKSGLLHGHKMEKVLNCLLHNLVPPSLRGTYSICLRVDGGGERLFTALAIIFNLPLN
jgi:hypothetical protein